jgi:hypothetical protein
LHGYRFGFLQTEFVENGCGGWPAIINGMTTDDVTFYFSNFDSFRRNQIKQSLPWVYAEGCGREFHWPIGDEFRSPTAPLLKDEKYVCTSEFLLRDCADKLVDERIKDMAGAGFMNQGVTLLTTHLSLERIARVQCMHQIVLQGAGHTCRHSEAMLFQLGKLSANLVRVEFPSSSTRSYRFASYPCYYDFADRPCGSLACHIELCLDKRSDFIAASRWESIIVEPRLPKLRKALCYWAPPGSPFRRQLC